VVVVLLLLLVLLLVLVVTQPVGVAQEIAQWANRSLRTIPDYFTNDVVAGTAAIHALTRTEN
jgi:hypothetical protein